MCSMAESRCCRVHTVFTILLLLGVFSLVSHFVADVVHLPGPQRVETPVNTDNLHGVSGAGHLTSLHGGFMLTEIPAPGFARAAVVPAGVATPDVMAWVPPTLLRPPIG